MGKKQKSHKAKSGPQLESAGDDNTKLFINSHEDVANSEDEFYIHRDKILLDEGPARKRQKQLEEQG